MIFPIRYLAALPREKFIFDYFIFLVIRDESLLEKMTVRGKQPLLGIGVEIKECFLHCGKAVKRSQIWNHTARAESPNLPSLAVMLKDQVDLPDVSVKELEQRIEESYTKRLY